MVDPAVPCLIVSTDKKRYMFDFLGPVYDAKAEAKILDRNRYYLYLLYLFILQDDFAEHLYARLREKSF